MAGALIFHEQKEQSHRYNGGAETGAGWGLHRHAGAGVNTPFLRQPITCAAVCMTLCVHRNRLKGKLIVCVALYIESFFL